MIIELAIDDERLQVGRIGKLKQELVGDGLRVDAEFLKCGSIHQGAAEHRQILKFGVLEIKRNQ